MRKFLSVVAACGMTLMSAMAWAQADLRNDHPDRYTVVKGDTLWGISSRFLQNPWHWPEIWQANPQIANPHLIYPGDVIGLVYVEGQPRLTTLSRSDNAGVEKLTPQKRITPLETAIPTIPLEAIQGFLTNTRIVDAEAFEKAPYVLEGAERHIVTGAGDKVYVRGEVTVDAGMGVFRQSENYVDPDTEEFLGMEARAIGGGQVMSVENQVATFAVQRTHEEILTGDRLLPTDDRPINPVFQPSAPKGDIKGKMIAVANGVTQIGQYDVVIVNRGTREGIVEGNVLAVYKKGDIAKDPYTKELVQLPAERAGMLMVVRAHEKVSYGLVLSATRPLAVMDEVRNP